MEVITVVQVYSNVPVHSHYVTLEFIGEGDGEHMLVHFDDERVYELMLEELGLLRDDSVDTVTSLRAALREIADKTNATQYSADGSLVSVVRFASGLHDIARRALELPTRSERARDRLAGAFRDWIHGTPLTQCGPSADTCPDWPLAYKLADMALDSARTWSESRD